MKIRLVTTCNAAGFRQYGRRMVDSFMKFWPQSVRLALYAEGFDYKPRAANIDIRRLPAWFESWKISHENNPDAHGRQSSRNRRQAPYDFRRDCVKFAHKVAALTDISKDPYDLLIWADADTLTHAPVTVDWLESLLPAGRSMAWLERPGTYPECGFMMFRSQSDEIDSLMRSLEYTYESDSVFGFEETHDSFVIQQLVNSSVESGCMSKPYSLCGKRDSGLYVFHYSRLGECLDHAKGNRKAHGRTPKEQILGRKEKHWQ